MYSGEVQKVSSKSWRELPVTLGFLAGLGATEVCAIGNWLDSASQGCNVMPWRYHRAKQLQATTLKHRLRFVIKDIVLDQAWHTWEEVDQGVLQQSMERSVDAAAAIMAFQTPTVYQFRGQHNLLIESRPCVSGPRLPPLSSDGPSSGCAGLSRSCRAASVRVRRLLRRGGCCPASPALPLTLTCLRLARPPCCLLRVLADECPLGPPVLSLPRHPLLWFWTLTVLAPPQQKAKPKARPKALIPLPPPGPPPAHVPRASQETDEEYFDRLGMQRWQRPGHANRPEPPTVVARWPAPGRKPVILLGGLPQPDDAELFRRHSVQMVISCFRETLAEKRAYVHPGARHHNITLSHPPSRGESWEGIRSSVFNTLAAGGSVYVHCMAGVHRAPNLAALLVAHVQGISFDDAGEHIRRLRAVEPEKLFERRGGDTTSAWLHRLADSQARPPVSVALPLRFLTSSRAGTALHVLAHGASEDLPQPACRWKQAASGSRSFFKDSVTWVDGVLTGVALGRPWCKTCVGMLPAGVQQALLAHHSVEFR